MVCPRCRSGDVDILRQQPEWSLHRCRTCSFGWRSTEPDQVTDPTRRPALFQLDPDDLPRLRQVLPPAPPRENST